MGRGGGGGQFFYSPDKKLIFSFHAVVSFLLIPVDNNLNKCMYASCQRFNFFFLVLIFSHQFDIYFPLS